MSLADPAMVEDVDEVRNDSFSPKQQISAITPILPRPPQGSYPMPDDDFDHQSPLLLGNLRNDIPGVDYPQNNLRYVLFVPSSM
jgi:hypothetical protein